MILLGKKKNYLCEDVSHGVFFFAFEVVVAEAQVRLEEMVVVDYHEMDY